jgi:hypothetical protein
LVDLAQRVGEGFERTLYIGLEHEVERGDLAALHHREDVFEAGTAGEAHRMLQAGGAPPVGACLGDRAGRLLVGGGAQLVARERDVVEAEHFHRGGRAGLLHLLAVLVEHGADLAPGAAGHDRVADPQRASLHQRGDHRAPTLVEVRLEHERPGRELRVGRELLDLGDEQDRLEQLVDADPGGRGDVDDDRVTAPRLGHELLLHELLAHAGGVGVFAVDLGDSDEDRHLGRARVVDGLDGLRHHAVVGRHHEDGDVGGVRTSRPHGGERLVTRRVDEGDRRALVHGLVRTDVLRDAARLTRHDVGVADGVEQRGLAVVDVTEHRDDRCAGLEVGVVFFVVVAEQRLELELGFLTRFDEEHLGAEGLGDELHHLVSQRLRAGDHLARVEQQPHEVGSGAVQLGRELLDGAAALDHDLALGNGRVGRRELRHRRGTEIFEIATTTLLAAGPLALRTGPAAATRSASGAAARATTTTGTAARAAAGALEAATRTTALTLEAATRTTATRTETTASAGAATSGTATGTTGATGPRGHAWAGRRRDATAGARRGRDRPTAGATRRCRWRVGCRRSGRCGRRLARGWGLGGGGRGPLDGRRRRGSRRGRSGRGTRRGRRTDLGDDAGGAHHPVRRRRLRRRGFLFGHYHRSGRRSGFDRRWLLDGRFGRRLGQRAALGLGLRRRFLDDGFAAQSLGVGEAAHAVG